VAFPLYPETDRDAGADVEYIACSANTLLFIVATQVDDPTLCKFVADDTPESVGCMCVDKTAIGNESNDSVLAKPVASPPKKPHVHIVELGLLRSARLDVGRFDALVDAAVGPVLVVVVFVLLVGIIRGIADDDADLTFVLALDPAIW
jgi:hypothetical protein